MKTLREMMDLIEAAQRPHQSNTKNPVDFPRTWHDVDPKLGRAVDKMSQAEKVKKGFAHPDTLKKKGVAEGISIVDQDSDLDQEVYTLNVDGKKVSFTYWDYENNFQNPNIKDIYQQAKEQLGRKLSPEQIKDVARAVFKSFEQGVAEGLGLYGPFTVTINTGERPQSRTKTKKFRREDDAILWAEDWLEDFSQYPFATAEVTDPDGNVVWTTDEQGVAEGSDHIGSMIQQYEDMVELVYDLPPGRKKNIAIDRRDALEAQIEAMPGGSEALRQWAKSYNDAMDEGVAEEQLEETTPEALAKIDELTRK